MDLSTMTQDVIQTPVSAAVHSTSTLLESEVPMTATSTLTKPRLDILDSHIATATLTPVVCIEEDVPILDTTTPLLTSLSMTSPIYTTCPVQVHIPVSHFLHPTAQTDNALVISQTEVQVSTPSVSNDLPLYHPMECEEQQPSTSDAHDTLSIHRIRLMTSGATPSNLSNDALSYHQIRLEEIPLNTQGIDDLSTIHMSQSEIPGVTHIQDPNEPSQFKPETCEGQTTLPIPSNNQPSQPQSVPLINNDNVLSAINQLSERIQTVHNNNVKDLEQMKDLMSNLDSKMNRLEAMMIAGFASLQTTLSKLFDDVKKGRMYLSL